MGAGTERERLAVLEDQMEKLMGNGQPGIVHSIWRKLESHSRMLYIGLGIMLALQFATVTIIGLLAAGIVKVP